VNNDKQGHAGVSGAGLFGLLSPRKSSGMAAHKSRAYVDFAASHSAAPKQQGLSGQQR